MTARSWGSHGPTPLRRQKVSIRVPPLRASHSATASIHLARCDGCEELVSQIASSGSRRPLTCRMTDFHWLRRGHSPGRGYRAALAGSGTAASRRYPARTNPSRAPARAPLLDQCVQAFEEAGSQDLLALALGWRATCARTLARFGQATQDAERGWPAPGGPALGIVKVGPHLAGGRRASASRA